MRYRLLTLVAMAIVLAPPAPVTDLAAAQGRGGRRNRDRRDNDDDRPAPERPAPPVKTAPSTTSFGTVSEGEKIRTSATDTIRKHDKSGNSILEGDELKDLGMSRGADLNSDGKITHDELVAFRMPKSDSAATATPAKPSVPPAVIDGKATGDIGERKIVNDGRKSYRFKSTKERLSTWKFASKDANGDGQVSMSEYTRSWTDRTAAEFLRYDKDNDGMITADEAK